VKDAIDDKTRAIFCETVSNPALEISPLEELAAVAKEAGTCWFDCSWGSLLRRRAYTFQLPFHVFFDRIFQAFP